MAIKKDLTGQKFERLTVVRFYGRNEWGQALWECKCSCGTENVIVTGGNLKSGLTRSCNCLRSEMLRERHKKKLPVGSKQ